MASATLLSQPRQKKADQQQGENEDTEDDSLQNRPRKKAIQTLEPALHILERFNHRNKNQHRLSKWWAQADMFRRQVRKILDGLYAGLEEEEKDVRRSEYLAAKGKAKNSSSVKNKKGKSGEISDGEESVYKRDGFGIYERVVYFRGVLVPRAWFAFTQLTADKRFAHLGLMLLATLAQVDQAVSGFAPGPSSDNEEEEELQDNPGLYSVGGQRQPRLSAAIQSSNGDKTMEDGIEEEEEDVGVAISRDEFLLSTKIDSLVSKVTTARSIDGDNTDKDADRDVAMDMDMDMDEDTSETPAIIPTGAAAKKKVKKTTASSIVEATKEEETIFNPPKKKRRTVEEEREEKEKDQDNEDEDEEWGGIKDHDDIGDIFESLIKPTKTKKIKTSKKALLSSSSDTKTTAANTKSSRDEKTEEGNFDDSDANDDDIGSIFDQLIPKKTKPTATKKKSKSSSSLKASSSALASSSTSVSAKSKEKEKEKDKGEKKKKKKRKQGDEFDDIFGGLL